MLASNCRTGDKRQTSGAGDGETEDVPMAACRNPQGEQSKDLRAMSFLDSSNFLTVTCELLEHCVCVATAMWACISGRCTSYDLKVWKRWYSSWHRRMPPGSGSLSSNPGWNPSWMLQLSVDGSALEDGDERLTRSCQLRPPQVACNRLL